MADDPRSRTQPVQQPMGQPATTEKKVPRLPHERDESSDSQDTAPRGKMKQAHDDVESGKMDTDRGAPANAAYQKQKRGGPAGG